MRDDPLNRLSVQRGEERYNAKLTEVDVRAILEIVQHRERLRSELSGLTNRALAEKFDVHHATIDKVVSGASWSHIA